MLPASSGHRASSSTGSRNDIFSTRPSASPAPPTPLPPRVRRAAPRSWLAASQHPDAAAALPHHTRIASDSSAPFAAALAAGAAQPAPPSAPPSASSAASSPRLPSSLPPSSPATPPGPAPGANSIFDLSLPLGLGLGLPPPRPSSGSTHVRKPSTGRRTEAQRAREHARIRHRSDQVCAGAELDAGDSAPPGTLYVDTDLSETTPDTDMDEDPAPPPGSHSPPALVSPQPNTPATPATPRTPDLLHHTRSRRRKRRINPVHYRLFPCPDYFLAEGRYCDVYLGSYRAPEGEWTLCAVKRLHADTQSQLVGLDEAYALRRLGKHQGIVQLIDIVDEMPTAPSTHVHHAPLSAPPGKAPTLPLEKEARIDPPRLLILLELLPHSLGTFVSAHPAAVDLRQWLDWGIELADAVAYMHSRGAIHADIKLDNCLLTMDRHLKLCDFNSTLWIDPANLPTDGAGLGTPAYSAPELTSFPDGPGFGFPVDIWAMGVVLYSLASGHPPYERATSMVDLLHRKPHFWQTEESDRARRLALAQGLRELERSSLSRSGTTTASVAGSTRSIISSHTPRTLSRSHSHLHRRGGSSIEQMTVTQGRIPSAEALSRLLAPSSPAPPPEPAPLPSSPRGGVPGRAVSMRAPPGHARKTGSSGLMINTHLPKRALRTPLSPFSPELDSPLATLLLASPASTNIEPGDAGIDADAEPEMIVPALGSEAGAGAGTGTGAGTGMEETEAEPSYADGMPALLLPGGGRLPDAARDLVRAMVSLDPSLRPSAMQVAERLRTIREACILGLP